MGADCSHRDGESTEADRKKDGVCIECGEKRHKIKECRATYKCFLCTGASLDHIPGSGRCDTKKMATLPLRLRYRQLNNTGTKRRVGGMGTPSALPPTGSQQTVESSSGDVAWDGATLG
ncbi:hypothetical protein Trydic_g1763 [Trypoxylus dichotomus]